MDGLAGPRYRASLPPLEIIASMESYLLRRRYLNLVFRPEFYPHDRKGGGLVCSFPLWRENPNPLEVGVVFPNGLL